MRTAILGLLGAFIAGGGFGVALGLSQRPAVTDGPETGTFANALSPGGQPRHIDRAGGFVYSCVLVRR